MAMGNSHITIPPRIREGLPPLDPATIIDFFRFFARISEGRINENGLTTVDSVCTNAEFFFAGFARATGNSIPDEDKVSGAYFLIIYYLPIYFQVIDNVSAAMSGVRTLPLILTVTISMLASGAYISITGIAAPIIVVGTAIGTVCMGTASTSHQHLREAT